MNWFDTAAAEELIYKRTGWKRKEPNTSHLMLRHDAPNTFRVLCTECLTQFDLFGSLTPPDDGAESEIVQRCLEHLGRCGEKKLPRETMVIQSRNTPNLFKLSVTWTT